MWVERLRLRNFRNYRTLDVRLEPGLVVVAGENAQGKSNLLEALQLLSIMKSSRASSERELVNRDAAGEEELALAAATVRAAEQRLEVQVSLERAPNASSVSHGPVRRNVRLNGIPRTAAEAVGRLNAVLFCAGDLELALGPPSARRRYMDVLLCQLDRVYMGALQRYQRVLSQRNHLLRRRGGAGAGLEGELEFWDRELIANGAVVMRCRSEVTPELAALAGQAYAGLAGREEAAITYQPSVGREWRAGGGPEEAFGSALGAARGRDLAHGATTVGPHRDELSLSVDGMHPAGQGSRGQARTLALALRLAEAELLSRRRGSRPVLLLDDVLSELDARRRGGVRGLVEGYEQVVLTTAEEELLEEPRAGRVARFVVRAGTLEPAGEPLALYRRVAER